ncbi:hypothetical protein D049_3187A, partial [Vibrio parahaemolyticus VPTS-2010]
MGSYRRIRFGLLP